MSTPTRKPSHINTSVMLANVFCYIINTVVVGLSQVGALGKSQVTVSAEYPTLVTPLPPFFSIWGLIYTLEAAFVLWQGHPSQADNAAVFKGIGPWFSIACLLQALWAYAFAQEATVVSSVLLVAITASLCKASIGLSRYRGAGKNATPFKGGWPEWLLTHATIGLHAGWTFAAAAVNCNVAVKAAELGQKAEVASALVSVIAAAIAAAVFSLKFHDIAFNAGVTWALLGIRLNPLYRRSCISGKACNEFAFVTTALVGLLVGVEAIAQFTRMKGSKAKST